MLQSGRTFLVCKTQKKGNVLSVYLREIDVGLKKKVVLWCNPDIHKYEFQRQRMWMNMINH